MLALVFTGGLADEVRSFLSLAERGERTATRRHRRRLPADGRSRSTSATASSTTLAREASSVPIDDEPRAVVGALVSAVRTVMRDPTWRCAVMTSATPTSAAGRLPRDRRRASPTSRSATSSAGHRSPALSAPARHVEGPWGAFAVVDVAVSDRLGAILYAPWEGRLDPTPAEIALLTLVGQHAGTALEHSLLYAQVRQQADELNRLAGVQADFLRGVTHDLQTPLTSIARPGDRAARRRAGSVGGAARRSRLDRPPGRAAAPDGRASCSSPPASRPACSPRSRRSSRCGPLVERTWAALRADRPFELDVTGPPHLAVADEDRLEQVLWARARQRRQVQPARIAGACRRSTRRTGCWPSRFATAAREWTTRDARARLRAVLSLRRRAPPRARRERRRPLRRAAA